MKATEHFVILYFMAAYRVTYIDVFLFVRILGFCIYILRMR
jgi:hypothetical protein